MSGDDQHGFFVQLYEDIEGVPKFIVEFESEVLGADVPLMGDCIIAPLRKADFAARDPATHYSTRLAADIFCQT
jgi:hypothetical protein